MHKHTNPRKKVHLQIFKRRHKGKENYDKAVPECQKEGISAEKKRIPDEIEDKSHNKVHTSLINVDLLSVNPAGKHRTKAKADNGIPKRPQNAHKKRRRGYAVQIKHFQGQIRRTGKKSGQQTKEKHAKNAYKHDFSVQTAGSTISFYLSEKTYFTQKITSHKCMR